jgi:glycine reductase
MALELAHLDVREIVFGPETALSGGRLVVEREALEAHLARIESLGRVRVELARPGERTRLVCVKDVVEPRVKPEGEPTGEGRVLALRGCAVATCGQIVGFQEGLLDMSGPGAAYSPFAELSLVVVEADPVAGIEPHRHEAALREAGLAAAAFLAGAAGGAAPDAVEQFALEEADACLPRVAYLYMLLSQGLLHDTWVEGRNAREGLPRTVDPRLALEGGIVSGNCVSACDKNTTWHHQHNPVIRELFRRHGRELAFAGCVLTNAPVRLAEKQASAEGAVRLARELGANGAVVSKEGFGNPDADLMMLVRGLEGAGIRTVALTDEFAGADGASQSLADATPEADALVSTGNANARIVLPAMERTLGPAASVPRLAGASAESARADGSIAVELQALLGATNELGAGRLTCRGL